MGDEIEGAVQQAAQPGRQDMLIGATVPTAEEAG